MPIDPNIAMSYKPVGLDIAGTMQAAEERKLMRSRNALAGTQQAAAQDELNNALAARRYAGGADLSDPQNAMRLLGYGKEGAEMFQSLQAGQASSATARKTKLEASGVKAGQYRQMLSFVNDPNAAMQWVQMHHDDPDMQDSPVARMPLDVAMSRIPQDPAGFQQWKQMAALGIDEYIKRNTMTAYEARPVATETAEGFEGITPTGETVWKRRAAPKSSGVTINTGERGNIKATEAVVESLVRTRDSLSQAPVLWQNLEEAKALIPQAKGFMGAGGEFSLEAASFLNNRFGTNIDVKGVKNATELRSRMFQGIVSTLKQLDSNPSQSQQAALQQALGGLGTDPNAMINVINVAQDIISGRVERYNKDATKASQKLDFPIDMPIQMPTRTAPTATGTPPPPPGFKIR
jgi:hypothetical protein